MATLNKVLLMGNLTRDPQNKAIQQTGTPVCDMGMAVNRRYKTQSGEEREEVIYVDLTAYGHQADYCVKTMTKGSTVYVEGHLRFDTWTDKDTGKNRSKLRVVVDTIFHLERKSFQNYEQQPPYPSAYGQGLQAYGQPPAYGQPLQYTQPQQPYAQQSMQYGASFPPPPMSAPQPPMPIQQSQPPVAAPQAAPPQATQPQPPAQNPQAASAPQPPSPEPPPESVAAPSQDDEVVDDMPF